MALSSPDSFAAADICSLCAPKRFTNRRKSLGRDEPARELDQDTLGRRRVLGDDHPDTLGSANNFATDVRASGKTGADP